QYKADVLRRVITFVGGQIREEDILCRYEATKFALLLPELTISQARDLLAGVENRFGAAAPDQVDEGYAELGISAGIACFSGQASADEIIQQAEQALETASGSEEIQIAMFEGGREPITAGV
ncbi:MAG: diguanylate cyclase, partial [Chloroflexota bacterium]